MGTWGGAESARSTYKNLLRVIEVISVWFSFELVRCCLFPSNASHWRLECPACRLPLNRTLFFFSFMLLLKVKRSAERQTPGVSSRLLQMCRIRGGTQLCFLIRLLACRGMCKCFSELLSGGRDEEFSYSCFFFVCFFYFRDFNSTCELLAYVYICFRLSAAV